MKIRVPFSNYVAKQMVAVVLYLFLFPRLSIPTLGHNYSILLISFGYDGGEFYCCILAEIAAYIEYFVEMKCDTIEKSFGQKTSVLNPFRWIV